MSTPPFLDLPPGTRAYHLATARGELAVLDAPTPGSRQPRGTALLVPGFTGSKEDFIAILAGLADAGYRAVAVDQRGQHESTGPDTPEAYTPDALSRDVLAVVEALGDGPVHLVGHSLGGLVARGATLADPGAVRSLTLLASGPAALPGPAGERAHLMLQGLAVYDLPTLWQAMQVVYAGQGGRAPVAPEIGEFLQRRFLGNSAACLTAMAQRLLDEPDRVAELAALDVPVLVAYGVDDDAWPPAVQAEMAERLGARHVTIDGAAHSPAVDQPEVMVEVLTGFWADLDGDGTQSTVSAATGTASPAQGSRGG